MLVEHALHRCGLIASWQFASQGFSTLLASLFGVVLADALTPADLQSWGWCLLFLFGALIGPIRIYIRNNQEDASPPPAKIEDISSFNNVVRSQKIAGLLSIGAFAISTAVNYLIISMPTYAVKTLNLPPPSPATLRPPRQLGCRSCVDGAGSLSDQRRFAASRMMSDMADATTWAQVLTYLVARHAPADVPDETSGAALIAWNQFRDKVRGAA